MKKKIKDLKCKDIECSNCPFEDDCGWVSVVTYTFGENFDLFIKKIFDLFIKEKEEQLNQEIEVEDDEEQRKF